MASYLLQFLKAFHCKPDFFTALHRRCKDLASKNLHGLRKQEASLKLGQFNTCKRKKIYSYFDIYKQVVDL